MRVWGSIWGDGKAGHLYKYIKISALYVLYVCAYVNAKIQDFKSQFLLKTLYSSNSCDCAMLYVQIYFLAIKQRLLTLSVVVPIFLSASQESNDDPAPSPSDTDRKDTHRKVLMQLQSIFGHLLEGRLQFHIPKGFWRDFRFVTLHVS